MLARCCVETFGLWQKKGRKRDSKQEQEDAAAATDFEASVRALGRHAFRLLKENTESQIDCDSSSVEVMRSLPYIFNHFRKQNV